MHAMNTGFEGTEIAETPRTLETFRSQGMDNAPKPNLEEARLCTPRRQPPERHRRREHRPRFPPAAVLRSDLDSAPRGGCSVFRSSPEGGSHSRYRHRRRNYWRVASRASPPDSVSLPLVCDHPLVRGRGNLRTQRRPPQQLVLPGCIDYCERGLAVGQIERHRTGGGNSG